MNVLILYTQNSFIYQRVAITDLILFKHKTCNEISLLRATLKKMKEKHENKEKSEEPTERSGTGKKYVLSPVYVLSPICVIQSFCGNQIVFAQHQCSYFFIMFQPKIFFIIIYSLLFFIIYYSIFCAKSLYVVTNVLIFKFIVSSSIFSQSSIPAKKCPIYTIIPYVTYQLSSNQSATQEKMYQARKKKILKIQKFFLQSCS